MKNYIQKITNAIYSYDADYVETIAGIEKIAELGLIELSDLEYIGATNPYKTVTYDLVAELVVITNNIVALKTKVMDTLYATRNWHMDKNIFYLGVEFVNNSDTAIKVTGVVLTALLEGKVDTDLVTSWDCVGVTKDLTFLELKTLGLLIGNQEKKARSALIELGNRYSPLSFEELELLDVAMDFNIVMDGLH
jgi:hypothetical protein